MMRPTGRTGLTVARALAIALAASFMADARASAQSVDGLFDRIATLREEQEIPAAQVALMLPDTTILWSFGEERPGVAVTDSTMFRIGSVTKSLAALAVLSLVDEGQVALNAPLSALDPELPIDNPWADSTPVTLAHLLEAGAGFRGFTLSDYGRPERPDVSSYEVIAERPGRFEVLYPPGQYSAYHNIGPTITARVIERLTGQSYEAVVRDRIFEPLGMERSSFFATDAVLRRLAPRLSDGGELPFQHIRHRPAGALTTSAREFSHLLRMLIERGTHAGRRVLSPEAIERFETPTHSLAARQLGLALGHGPNNWTTTVDSTVYHGHGGLIAGYSAYFGYSPATQRGFVYMGRRGLDGQDIHRSVVTAIFEFFHPERSAASGSAPPTWDALVGCFELLNPLGLGRQTPWLRLDRSGTDLVLTELQDGSSSWVLETSPFDGVLRLRGGRGGQPGDALVAHVTDESGTPILQFLDYRHEAYARRSCDQVGD